MNKRELQPLNIVSEINNLVEPYDSYRGRLDFSGSAKVEYEIQQSEIKLSLAERRAMKRGK